MGGAFLYKFANHVSVNHGDPGAERTVLPKCGDQTGGSND